MVKTKNRKRISVDDVHKKRQQKNVKKPLNPFEVHINNEKMRVLGKKSKNQHGVPGISRAKAIQKRKNTLLPEYKLQNKSNKFVDNRALEYSTMSNEEKVAARFAAYQSKYHSKPTILNLSGEVLSHKNHTLIEIEKFEDLNSDEDSDDDEIGQLDSNYVEKAHFGSGKTKNNDLIDQIIQASKKRKIEMQKNKETAVQLTERLDCEWKDLAQLMIKNPKKDKKEEQDNTTAVDDYDKYMRELRFEAKGTVSDRLKTEDEIAKAEKEKLEKLESERLQRMKGMTDTNTSKKTHRSADDLDDDFEYEPNFEENMLSYDITGHSNVEVEAELNGKRIGQYEAESELSKEEISESDNEEDTSESDNEEDGDSNSEDSLADLKQTDESETESITEVTINKSKKEITDSKEESKITKRKAKLVKEAQNEPKAELSQEDCDSDSENSSADLKQTDESETEKTDNKGESTITKRKAELVKEAQDEAEAELSEEEASESDGDSDSDDSLANLKHTSQIEPESITEKTDNKEESTLETPSSTLETSSSKPKKQSKTAKRKSELVEGNITKKLKMENELEKVNDKTSKSEKIKLEKASGDLPFTFKLPESYESLMEIINEKSHDHQTIILERMIKCNHPSLAQGNKESLGVLFDYLLQYINDLFSDIENDTTLEDNFKLLRSLMPYIYNLAQLNPENTHKSVLEVIKEKHQEYRKKKKNYPDIEVLVFLKLVSLLFSTSDFRHQIVTPCFVFIEQMLKNCVVKTAAHVSYGIFLCTLVLEYTSLSNRFLPTTINFLSGILHMAIPKNSVKVVKIIPPFKPLCNYLVLKNNSKKVEVSDKLHIKTLMAPEFTDEFKVQVLGITFKLLDDFREHFKNYRSNVEIFSGLEQYISQIPLDLYPEKIKDECSIFCDNLSKLKSERKLEYLVLEAKRPKALRLYEPKFEKIYVDQKLRKSKREKDLIHKLKREKKGVVRELKRDNAFLGRIKINKMIESDKERKQKVNRIYAEAAAQNEPSKKKKKR